MAEGNGNGSLRVPLAWLQFFLVIATLIGGFWLSTSVQGVRSEFQHVEVLKETNRHDGRIQALEARVYALELTLVAHGIDVREPSITITRRQPKEPKEDQ